MDKNRKLIALAEHEAARFWKVDFNLLTEAERVFLLVWEVEGEVNNGGFAQYYGNSAGERAARCPGALQSIGAGAMAKIVEEANAVFGDAGPPEDREAREATMAAMPEDSGDRWEKLDDQFFEYPDNLTELLYAWVATWRGGGFGRDGERNWRGMIGRSVPRPVSPAAMNPSPRPPPLRVSPLCISPLPIPLPPMAAIPPSCPPCLCVGSSSPPLPSSPAPPRKTNPPAPGNPDEGGFALIDRQHD